MKKLLTIILSGSALIIFGLFILPNASYAQSVGAVSVDTIVVDTNSVMINYTHTTSIDPGGTIHVTSGIGSTASGIDYTAGNACDEQMIGSGIGDQSNSCDFFPLTPDTDYYLMLLGWVADDDGNNVLGTTPAYFNTPIQVRTLPDGMVPLTIDIATTPGGLGGVAGAITDYINDISDPEPGDIGTLNLIAFEAGSTTFTVSYGIDVPSGTTVDIMNDYATSSADVGSEYNVYAEGSVGITNGATFAFSGLTPDTTYWFMIFGRVVGSADVSPYQSPPIKFKTTEDGEPEIAGDEFDNIAAYVESGGDPDFVFTAAPEFSNFFDQNPECTDEPGKYCLIEPLPGFGAQYDYSRGLGDYVNNVMRVVLGILGVLAVLSIVVAGIQYMMSDVITNKQDAKKRIMGAIFGLILAFSIFIILQTINPDLLNVNPEIKQAISVVDAPLDIPENPPEEGKGYCGDRNLPYVDGGGGIINTKYLAGLPWNDNPQLLLRESLVRGYFGTNGLTINKLNCSAVGVNNCTSVFGISNSTVTKLAALENACQDINSACEIEITGGTECWLHSEGTKHTAEDSGTVDISFSNSHFNNFMDNIIITQVDQYTLDNISEANRKKITGLTAAGSTFRLIREVDVPGGDHWHIEIQ